MTVGLLNANRKVAVHISAEGRKSKNLWKAFFEQNKSNHYEKGLMSELGDKVYENGLAVMVRVRDVGMIFRGSLRVERYLISIFDPEARKYDEIVMYIHRMMRNESPEGLAQDVMEKAFQNFVYSAIPIQQTRRHSRGMKRQ